MRRVAFVVGAALVAYGGYELVTGSSLTSLRAAATWLAGGVVLHDGVLVPLTLLGGVALARLLPGAWRGLVQGALVVSAMITLPLLPLLSGAGLDPRNPSQQPLAYGRGLLLVLGGVWALTGLLALRRTVQSRRRPAHGAVTRG